jgi:hypothetical protein
MHQIWWIGPRGLETIIVMAMLIFSHMSIFKCEIFLPLKIKNIETCKILLFKKPFLFIWICLCNWVDQRSRINSFWECWFVCCNILKSKWPWTEHCFLFHKRRLCHSNIILEKNGSAEKSSTCFSTFPGPWIRRNGALLTPNHKNII